MPIIRPIPKQFLIHSIDYEEYQGPGNFGESWGERETISNVLVQPKSSIRIDANGEEIQLSALIFLDAVNTPNFKPLQEKSKVYFQGREMRVHACNLLYAFDGKTPHHYEVECV